VLLERAKTKNALCYEPRPSSSPHKSITFKGRLSSVCGSIVAGLGFSEYAPAPKHKNTPKPGSRWNFLAPKLRHRQGKSYRGRASVFLNFHKRGDEWLAWRRGRFIVMENLADSSW